MHLHRIEGILADCFVHREQQFLVKWKGYHAEKDSSLEGNENFQDSEGFITRFLSKKKAGNKEVKVFENYMWVDNLAHASQNGIMVMSLLRV